MLQIWADVAVLILIYSVYGSSLTVVIGYTGIPAVAPTAFGAIGGYMTGWLALRHGWNAYLALGLSVIAVALFAMLLSVLVLQLSDVYVILLTVALGTIVVGVIPQVSFLGGPYGLDGIPIPSFFGLHMSSPASFIPAAGVVATLSYLFVRRIGNSNFGLVLRAVRDDDVAVRASGFNPTPAKVVAFAVSAGLASAAGGSLAIYNQVVTPSTFGFTSAILIVAAGIIGGITRPAGAVLGAVFIQVIPTLLQQYLNMAPSRASLIQQVVFGVVLVLVMILRPQGVITEKPSRITRWANESAARPESEAPAMADDSAVTTISERTGEAILTAYNIRKSFGGVVAANGFEFQLLQGQVVGLIGPNGAGKTTLFNLLTGALRKDAGTVTLIDADVTNMRMDQIANAGMARSFQEIRLWPTMTAVENVFIGALEPRDGGIRSIFPSAGCRGRTREALERAQGCLATSKIEDKTAVFASELSYGEQKLLGMARVLATDAAVVLLDEPAAGVGHEITGQIMAQIQDMVRRNKSILLVEHNLEVVRQVATWCYFMEQGSVRTQGTYDELVDSPELAASYFGAPKADSQVSVAER
jgi:branched-chain amino acid transport system permease protein